MRLGEHNTVDWLVPDFSAHSGGHRTISRMAKGLEGKGFKSRFILMNAQSQDFDYQKRILIDNFGLSNFEVTNCAETRVYSETAICTSWQSAYVMTHYPSRYKYYFIQDSEDLFYSGGTASELAIFTYYLPFKKIALGKWLGDKIAKLTSHEVATIDFAVDKEIYYADQVEKKQVPLTSKQNLVIYFQPSKARRCPELIYAFLEQLSESKFTGIEVTLVGEQIDTFSLPNLHINFESTKTDKELANLYRKSHLGIVMSATNPSLVPFEMIACGMPVIVNKTTSSVVDLEFKHIHQVEPLPSEILRATCNLLNLDKETPKVSTHNANSDFNTAEELLDWNNTQESFCNVVLRETR